MTTYTFKRSDGKNAALRSKSNATGTPKPYPNIPQTLLTSAGYITPAAEIKGDGIFTLPQIVKNESGAIVGNIGDKWLHVVSINDYPVDGYTAVLHMGVSQGVLTEISTTPTPEPEPTPQPELPKLKSAVNAANAGDTITVEAGAR